MIFIDSENAFTKCPFCAIIYPLVPPDGERRHDDTDDEFRGCNAPVLPNPRDPDDPNGRFTCYSCNITEGFRSTDNKIKCRFSAKQRRKGAFARCESCVTSHRKHQFPAFLEECCDKSVGAKFHHAIERADVGAVSSLLSAGASPNSVSQANIYGDGHDFLSKFSPYDYVSYPYDCGVEPFLDAYENGMKLAWNQDGSIVHNIDGRYPLSHAKTLMSDRNDYHFEYVYDPFGIRLNAIVRMLIDAGASFNSSDGLVGIRSGDRSERFGPSDRTYHWADITLWRARNAIRQVLEQCQKDNHFDFGKYFQEKKDSFPLPQEAEEDEFGERACCDSFFYSQEKEENDKDCFPLTEKAVQASSELLPFYYVYTERRAIARLQSHRSSLFSGRQGQDGEFLPALPTEIEARIRSLALLSAENPILASQIPDPIAHDSD
jgi:hypothetical protein